MTPGGKDCTLCVQMTSFDLDVTEAYLDADSFDDARNNVENLHFGVAFIDLLQQLEQQAENRLQVLKRNKIDVNEGL